MGKEDEQAKSRMFKNTFLTLVINIAGVFVTFLTNVFVARKLGAAAYGQYSVAILVMTFGSILTQFGIPQMLIRITAINEEKGKVGARQGHLQSAAAFVVASTVPIILVAFVADALITIPVGAFDIRVIFLAVVAIPFLNITNVIGSYLIGQEHTVTGALVKNSLGRGMVFFCVCFASILLPSSGLTPTSFVGINFVGHCIAFFIGCFLIVKNLDFKKLDLIHYRAITTMLHASVPFAINSIVQTSMTQIDSFFVGVFCSPEDVGIYRVSVQAGALIVLALGAVNTVLAPRMAKLHERNEVDALQAIVVKGARYAFIVALFGALIFAAFGKQLLIAVFGVEYLPAYSYINILVYGQVVNAAFGPVGFVLSMTGHADKNARGTVIALTLNLVLCTFCVPRFGPYAAACVASMSVCVWNLILCYYARKEVGVTSFAFWKIKKML